MWTRVETFILGILILTATGYFVISYFSSGFGGDTHPLKGQSAPELKLKTMDGSELQLSSIVNGKKAIVIDFWATWCGPCRKALPTLEKLAQGYNSNQVIFLGINVWDGDIAEIKKFLKANDIKTVNILLDKEENASQKYSFNGIPAIFILDSNMKVHTFFSGYSSSLDSEIKKNIDSLL